MKKKNIYTMSLKEVDAILEQLLAVEYENTDEGFRELYVAYQDALSVAQYYKEIYDQEFKPVSYVPEQYWDKSKNEYKADPEMESLMNIINSDWGGE